MKHAHPSFSFYENTVKLSYKKAEFELFKNMKSLRFINRNFHTPDRLNVIGVSRAVFSEFSCEKLFLINPLNGEHTNVSLSVIEDISDVNFIASPYLKELLKLTEEENIFLCPYKNLIFKKIYLQKIDHIRENNLILSEFDYNNLPCDIQNSPCKLFEIYNSFSHNSIIVQKSHIFVDKTLAPGTIRLNRKQRICLGLELPEYLSNEQWASLEKKLAGDNDALQTLYDVYSSESRILNKLAPYDKKQKAKKIITQHFSGDLHIIPVPESVHSVNKNILRKLCNFYVGKSTLSLVGRRPYDIDEGLDIVRMTKCNMNLLGIDEMDKVILQYKNKKVSCRVLELEDKSTFLETNLPISPDLAIGIPAHIRKKLNLCDLSSSIKIDRDTPFIFKKSMNEQIVPVLLTLFSTNLFTDSSILLSALLSILAIPIVLYFNLSSKRNMRS